MHYLERLNTQKQELLKVEVLPPLSETLLENNETKSIFNPEITENPNFQKEIKERKKLISELENFYRKIPNSTTTIDEAFTSGKLSQEEIDSLLNKMVEALKNPENSRVLLYLPSELIPIDSSSKAKAEFREQYLKTWKSILPIHDYRTNFVDGDILEPELLSYSGQAEISKVAHLLPILLNKKILTVAEVISLCEQEKDNTVKESIFDALPASLDLGLISENDLTLMHNSKDQGVRNMSIILKDQKNNITTKQEIIINSNNIFDNLEKRIAEKNSETQIDDPRKPEARVVWEKKRDDALFVKELGKKLGKMIAEKTINTKELSNFANKNTPSSLIVIEGIKESGVLSKELEVILKSFENSKDPEILDAVHSAWAVLQDTENFEHYSKTIVPVETEKLKEEVSKLNDFAKSIENDEKLKNYLYPALIMYGSKVKGYGTSRADTDIALFIRPDVNQNKRKEIKTLIEQKLKDKNINEVPLELWLEENNDTLEIINSYKGDNEVGESHYINILLNGVWSGEKSTIKEICNKLVANYFYNQNQNERRLLLKDLERDTLQYRLMHKGYSRLHKSEPGFNTPHAKDIDGNSTFWDPGYRRLATRLFLQKVFLPKLEK